MKLQVKRATNKDNDSSKGDYSTKDNTWKKELESKSSLKVFSWSKCQIYHEAQQSGRSLKRQL